MRFRRIPDETIRRLPVYFRALLFFAEQGSRYISSSSLAELVGLNSWQIRKDFSYFGGFGTRGVGYEIAELLKQIRKILKIRTGQKIALVGVGNLGSAMLAYPGFQIYGFEIVAAFDNNPKKIGKKVKNVKVEDVAKLGSLKRRRIRLAIIAVPCEAAQNVADKLVNAGVRGILNFSPCYITVPSTVKVITIDIAMDLARLPYYVPGSVFAEW